MLNTSLMAFDMIQKKGLIERSHISRCAITKNTTQYWKLKLNKMEVK